MSAPPQRLNAPLVTLAALDATGVAVPVDPSHPLPTGPVSPSGAASTATNGSGTITSGGTAQNLFAGAIPANGFEVVNPDPTEDLWVSFTTTAVANGVGCIRVVANGGSYFTPPGMRPGHAVSVVAVTTNHKFSAWSW